MAICPVDCDCVALDALADIPPPAVVVLGERHASKPDLKLAAEAVERLAETAPVTVALEAVDHRKQAAMDQLVDGSLKPKQVEPATDWGSTWGHAFKPYLKVFKSGMAVGADFVGAGLPIGPAPDDLELKIPERYVSELGATAAQHGMDPNVFASSMAWRDLVIAEKALEGWSGEGYLVILTGRGHVTDGLGVPWQIREGLSEVPVVPYLLASEGCATGDKVLGK
jgi:uncharacterized iron-regulated protein